MPTASATTNSRLTEISRFSAISPELAELPSEFVSAPASLNFRPFRPLCLCPQNSVSPQRRLRFEETRSMRCR